MTVVVTEKEDSSSSDEEYDWRPSTIRGDYSTVTNVVDVTTLAANVPFACFRTQKHCGCDNEVSTTIPSLNSRIIPVPRTFDGWTTTHQINLHLALSNDDAARRPPTVVFYGDSITERWHGTQFGLAAWPELEDTGRVFDTLFRNQGRETILPAIPSDESSAEWDVTIPNSNSTTTTTTTTAPDGMNIVLEGLPLGIAGDTTPNLLWRLQNGELPPTLDPRIFVVLIGTNDLGRDWCSPENIVAGIIRVVEELLHQRPHSQVLLHGLLPRTFSAAGYLYNSGGDGDNNIGSGSSHSTVGGQQQPSDDPPFVWEDLEAVNDELQRYARYREGVTYFSTDVFFKDFSNNRQIDMALMPDGLHPSVRGYEVWGADLKLKLLEMLQNSKPRLRGNGKV